MRGGPVLPDTGLVTLAVRPGTSTTLRGRVVTAGDRPVVGATVAEQRPGCATAPGRNAMRFDARVVTDEDGRFELPVRGGLHVIVDGPDIVPVRVPLASPLSTEPPRKLAQPICAARWPGRHRAMAQEVLEVERELARRRVAAVELLLERLHRDPVEVAVGADDCEFAAPGACTLQRIGAVDA